MTTAKQFLTVGGHKIAYLAAGDPSLPPVLMLHGLTSHAGIWSNTIEALSSTHYCVALDHLGFADSDKPDDGDYSVEAHAKRALQAADALGLDRFVLMGHSMGGQMALYIASVLAPERVEKMVCVDGVVTGRLSLPLERFLIPRMQIAQPFPLLWMMSRALMLRFKFMARAEFWMWFYDFDSLPYDSWELDRKMAIHPDLRFSAYRSAAAIKKLDLTPHLGKINVPTLVISGKEDNTVPVEQAILASEKIPNCRLKVIERCGHFPMYEQPRTYLDVVRWFV